MKLLLFLVFGLLFAGCWGDRSVDWKAIVHVGHITGTGPIVSRAYELESFKLLKISGNVTVDVTYGDKQSIIIETQENIFPYLNVYSNRERLRIGVNRGKSIHTEKPIKVNIVTPQPVEQASLSGAVAFKLGEGVQPHLRLLASGACKIDTHACKIANVNAIISGSCQANIFVKTKLHSILSGASTLIYHGEARQADFGVSGTGTIRGEEAPVDEMSIKVAGAADIQVNVVRLLDVDASGTASIIYSGNPVINQKGYGVVKVYQKEK